MSFVKKNLVGGGREPLYDLLKGLGMFFVVLGHTTRNLELTDFLYSFHMPLFFFISGMLFHDSSNFFQKKAKTLLIPYIVFALLSFVYWRFVEIGILGQIPSSAVDLQLKNIFYPMNIKNAYVFNSVLWFLPALFFTEILLWFVEKSIYFKSIVAFVVLGVVAILHFYRPYVPFCISQAILSLPFLYVGTLVNDFCLKIPVSTKLQKIPVLFLSVCFFVAVFFSKCHNNILRDEFANGYLHFCFFAFIGIFACVLFCKVIGSFKIVEIIGKYSLPIMLIHEPIKRMVIFVYSKILSLPVSTCRENVLHSIILAIVILGIVVPIGALLVKKCKYAFGKF